VGRFRLWRSLAYVRLPGEERNPLESHGGILRAYPLGGQIDRIHQSHSTSNPCGKRWGNGTNRTQRTSELLTGQMDKDSQSHVARKQGMPTLPVPPKVTAGVKKVGGTDWKGGWHRLSTRSMGILGNPVNTRKVGGFCRIRGLSGGMNWKLHEAR